MFRPTQQRGDAALVVVLQEMSAGVEELRRQRKEMTLRLRIIAGNQIVVPSLVVSVIESEFLQRRFQIPVHFGKKQKIRLRCFDGSNRVGPELSFCGSI